MRQDFKRPSLMKSVPPTETRSQKELLFHYNLEKKLADRLRHADQKERKRLYPELYAELRSYYRLDPAGLMVQAFSEGDLRRLG